jgi:hypothetical protein
MRREAREFRDERFSIAADGRVELELSSRGERHDGSAREHLRRRAETEKHVGCHRLVRLHTGDTETFGEDDPSVFDDGDRRARCARFFQLVLNDFFKLS